MLGRLGYEVVTKQSSIEALELFRAEPDRFDLVITDMTMPHMTGDKLAQEFMKIRPDIPIILCTGHSRLVSEKKAKEIGIKAFVMKPILRRTIAEAIRKALDWWFMIVDWWLKKPLNFEPLSPWTSVLGIEYWLSLDLTIDDWQLNIVVGKNENSGENNLG